MPHVVDVGDSVNPARKAQIVPDQSLMALVDCYNKAGRQFVDKARSLLNTIDHGEPEYTRAASVQLDKIVHAWWEQALAANTAKPEMVRAALTTRMDTNAVSEMPIGMISKAIQDMRLSASQKDIIATAYSRYRNTLPSVEKRKEFLQQLEEAASNKESSKQEESGSSRCKEVLRELGACFMNAQQACTALTTVSTSESLFHDIVVQCVGSSSLFPPHIPASPPRVPYLPKPCPYSPSPQIAPLRHRIKAL